MEKDRIRNQLKETPGEQVLYLGRWVDKQTFCAFVYDVGGNEKLAKSYDEYQSLVGSGLYFATLLEAQNPASAASKEEIEAGKTNEALAKIKSIKDKVRKPVL
jgi:hypothetical protein